MKILKTSLLLLVALATTLSAKIVKTDEVEAELVSESQWIQPGQPFTIGIRMKMSEGWHTYWKNAGDAGLATSVNKWTLPEGFKAGDIQWPHPERIDYIDLVNFGYHDEILLPIEITPPKDLPAGQDVTIGAELAWLACKEACIPQGGKATLTLPVKTEAPAAVEKWTGLFKTARLKRPVTDSGWAFTASFDKEAIRLKATPSSDAPTNIAFTAFFPDQEDLMENAADQTWTSSDGGLLTIKRNPFAETDPEEVTGVLVAESGWTKDTARKAIRIDAKIGAAETVAAADDSGKPKKSFLMYIVFAFFGGILLNLMPCVFPVLSIKILGFVQQSQEQHDKPWKHGLAFAAGVLISFWILVGILVSLRAAGDQVGWAFHMQSPEVVIVLTALFFLMALSLFGVFEFGLSLAGVGAQASGKSNLTGSFLSGFLATVVATPCTGPLMAPAIGYALTESLAVTFVIFTFLAVGMALPFTLLTFFPALMKKVPRPGPWMESLKQFMGFLLAATAVAGGIILNDLVGGKIWNWVAGSFLVMGLGAWILGRWGAISRGKATRVIARILAAVVIVAGVGMAFRGLDADKNQWEAWSEQRISELQADGKMVFVDFTATWCAICQVNKGPLHSEKVEKTFKEYDVVPLLADWTRKDPVIAKELEKFGRVGVPLYLVYSSDPSKPPTVLPENLTQGIVIKAIEDLKK